MSFEALGPARLSAPPPGASSVSLHTTDPSLTLPPHLQTVVYDEERSAFLDDTMFVPAAATVAETIPPCPTCRSAYLAFARAWNTKKKNYIYILLHPCIVNILYTPLPVQCVVRCVRCAPCRRDRVNRFIQKKKKSLCLYKSEIGGVALEPTKENHTIRIPFFFLL